MSSQDLSNLANCCEYNSIYEQIHTCGIELSVCQKDEAL